MGFRESARRVVDARWFQKGIIALIAFNAVVLGLETVPALRESIGWLLRSIDTAMLAVFTVEIATRIYVHRTRYFRDAWSVFDLVVVVMALIPPSGPFLVLRALRVLRVLWLLSSISSLRRVVAGVLKALPGMASIGLLLALLMYVAGVIATLLFQETDPENFGSLGATLFTLFQVMTGDSWASEIARPVIAQHPSAWIFFITYFVLSTFIVLNWFIAVAVDAFERVHLSSDDEEGGEALASRAAILAEVKAMREDGRQLRAEIAALRTELTTQRGGEPELPG